MMQLHGGRRERRGDDHAPILSSIANVPGAPPSSGWQPMQYTGSSLPRRFLIPRRALPPSLGLPLGSPQVSRIRPLSLERATRSAEGCQGPPEAPQPRILPNLSGASLTSVAYQLAGRSWGEVPPLGHAGAPSARSTEGETSP